MSSLLVRCYPAAWRDRYGTEFEALLEDLALGPLDVADILAGALDARLRLHGHETAIARGKAFVMSLRIGGIAAILGAILWAVAGLLNWASWSTLTERSRRSCWRSHSRHGWSPSPA